MSQQKFETNATVNSTIKSKPTFPEKSGGDKQQRFGFCELKGLRNTQEDTLIREILPPLGLTPEQIAERLWTTLKIIDQKWLALQKDKEITAQDTSGSTACITVFDGKDKLITVTLGDSEAYAVEEGNRVTRLNSKILNPNNEKTRIEGAGGSVLMGRISGALNISRALGDIGYKNLPDPLDEKDNKPKKPLILSNTTVDIRSMKSAEEILITACDGYTETAGEKTEAAEKQMHEDYLQRHLTSMPADCQNSEQHLATYLANQALKEGSKDNISVAVTTLRRDSNNAQLVGVFDGHVGSACSHFAADEFLTVFKQQCQLDAKAYAQQELSAHKQQEDYKYDNKSISLSNPNDSSPKEYQETHVLPSQSQSDDEVTIYAVHSRNILLFWIKDKQGDERCVYYTNSTAIDNITRILGLNAEVIADAFFNDIVKEDTLKNNLPQEIFMLLKSPSQPFSGYQATMKRSEAYQTIEKWEQENAANSGNPFQRIYSSEEIVIAQTPAIALANKADTHPATAALDPSLDFYIGINSDNHVFFMMNGECFEFCANRSLVGCINFMEQELKQTGQTEQTSWPLTMKHAPSNIIKFTNVETTKAQAAVAKWQQHFAAQLIASTVSQKPTPSDVKLKVYKDTNYPGFALVSESKESGPATVVASEILDISEPQTAAKQVRNFNNQLYTQLTTSISDESLALSTVAYDNNGTLITSIANDNSVSFVVNYDFKNMVLGITKLPSKNFKLHNINESTKTHQTTVSKIQIITINKEYFVECPNEADYIKNQLRLATVNDFSSEERLAKYLRGRKTDQNTAAISVSVQSLPLNTPKTGAAVITIASSNNPETIKAFPTTFSTTFSSTLAQHFPRKFKVEEPPILHTINLAEILKQKEEQEANKTAPEPVVASTSNAVTLANTSPPIAEVKSAAVPLNTVIPGNVAAAPAINAPSSVRATDDSKKEPVKEKNTVLEKTPELQAQAPKESISAPVNIVNPKKAQEPKELKAAPVTPADTAVQITPKSKAKQPRASNKDNPIKDRSYHKASKHQPAQSISDLEKSKVESLSVLDKLKIGFNLADLKYSSAYINKYQDDEYNTNRSFRARPFPLSFTFFRHGNAGLKQSEQLSKRITNCQTIKELIEQLDTFLSAKSRNTHIHSAFSYYMDEAITFLKAQNVPDAENLPTPRQEGRYKGRYQKSDWQTVKNALITFSENSATHAPK